MSNVADPFDDSTYNIPEKPVSATKRASYTIGLLAGLGIAAVAEYWVFKESDKYKIFSKSLERIQNDNGVTSRIGSPITGYGMGFRNLVGRPRIVKRTWTQDGMKHMVVNFEVRGPYGHGLAMSVMFKDKVDNQWKFKYLSVEVRSPSFASLVFGEPFLRSTCLREIRLPTRFSPV